jgi:excisionase family DNA binding protein
MRYNPDKTAPEELTMADTFYTADELAALLKVTPQAIYNWIQQGRMEAVRIGRTVRIPAAEVERVLRDGRTVGRARNVRKVHPQETMCMSSQLTRNEEG